MLWRPRFHGPLTGDETWRLIELFLLVLLLLLTFGPIRTA